MVFYRTTSSVRGGCIYKRVDVMAVRVWCQGKIISFEMYGLTL